MIRGQKGFTIVELLIATAILSFILLLVSGIMSNIGAEYFKGINQATTQSDARSISEQITQDVQLSETTPSGGGSVTIPHTSMLAKVLCIGNIRYTYIVNQKIGTNGYQHILWRDIPNNCDTSIPAYLNDLDPSNPGHPYSSGDGSELIASNSSLTALNLNVQPNGLYILEVGVAYGDINLLDTSISPPGCIGGSGFQYCATSDIKTVIVRRLK